MITSRFTMRVLATLTLWAGFGLTAAAQLPNLTVDKALEIKPRQPNVGVVNPEQPNRCRVEPIPNPKTPGTNLGYVVRDDQNRPVRQFVSYDGKAFNIVAFYTNGVESYREVYPPQPNEAFQFRWLGPNGGKWGLDKDRDGRIDEWVVISPEEASQELLQAVVTRDAKRLESLLITQANLDSLGIPAAEAGRITARASTAAKKLIAAADALQLSPQAKWIHLELGVPHTTPADTFGGRDDLVVHKRGTILIEDGGKTHLMQTGELILIGRAWKLVDGPTPGAASQDSNGGSGPVITQEIADLVKKLDEVDKTAATLKPEELPGYYGKRAEVLEQIVQKLPPDKQADWVRLLIDSLAAASEGGKADNPHHARLKVLKDALAKGGAGNPVAAYAAFRLLIADNAIALKEATPKSLPDIQEKWRVGLEEFIKAYPTSDDAGEAVLRLAMAFEFMGKDGEPKAKSWYEFLTKNYPNHTHAAKAVGAIRRLDSEGKAIDLQGPNMATGQNFAVSQMAGKVVVVYFWASWGSTLQEDAKKLKELVTTYGPKGLELVGVCLDDDPKTAAQAIQGLGLPGTHLHQAGGLDRSPLAAQYGIMVVPHVIVAGKDGKVTNRNAQITTLDDDLKKMMP